MSGWFPFLSATNITKLERLHRAAISAITDCLSFSPIPPLLSEASLPPLRFTSTHFTFSSYEWALRLPTSFPILGLTRLGVKSRLCRSSWRAFASTHPLMLSSTCSREALLACPPFPWKLPSFTVESTSSCSRSDLLNCEGAALVHLDSLPGHDLALWTDGSVPFPSAKDDSGVLVHCFLCDTKATHSFSAGPDCSSFSAEACATLHVLCWFWQHHEVCHFSYLTFVLSSPHCLLFHFSFYLKLFGRLGRNCFFSPPVLSDYNGSPDTHFSQRIMLLMSWPGGERYLHPLQSL